MKIPRSAITKTVVSLLESGAKKATTYLNADTVVRATLGFKPTKRSRSTTVMLTMGQPNFREREFIKSCKKAGEPLPVRRVQLKHWPKR